MLIRYTTDILYTKPDAGRGAGAFLGRTKWRETDADLGVLFNLFCVGHAVHISDTEWTDAFIIDLDHLTPEQADRVHSPAFLGEVKELFDAEQVIVHDSASRKYTKQKIFVRKRYRRRLREGNDRAYWDFILLFEKAFGMQCDKCMREWWRLTWPCRDKDAAYTPETMAAMKASRPVEKQPLKEEVCGEAKARRIRKPGENIPEPADEGRKFQFVQLNPGAYNRKYGKMAREGGRLEWNIYRYAPGKEKILWTIGKGKRDAALPRLYAAIVWNAIFQNMAGWKPLDGEFVPFVLEDCLGTLKATVRLQFEDGEAFWAEAHAKARAQLAALWDECIGMDPDAVYTMLLERTGAQRREKYVPRGEATTLFERCRDALAACKDYAEVKDMCGELAYGEVRTMKALLRLCRKDKGIPAPTTGRGRKADFSEYLKGCPKDAEGRFLVDTGHARTRSFRDFCRAHGHMYTTRKF